MVDIEVVAIRPSKMYGCAVGWEALIDADEYECPCFVYIARLDTVWDLVEEVVSRLYHGD